MINEEEIIDIVFYIIDYWKEDTMNLSYPTPDHFAIKIIQKLAEYNRNIVIRAILLYTKEHGSWIFTYIPLIVENKKELPEIPEEVRGKFKLLREMYINWGKKLRYIN